MNSPKLALPPPSDELALMTRARVEEAVEHSRKSPRRRIIAPLHRSQDDPLHRMLNAIQPGSYCRPHRHADPPKSEAWIVLRGSLLFVTFHEDGSIATHHVLSAGGELFGVDLVPGHYHTILALEPDTVIYEVKTGPYTQATDKSFAPFAPPEHTPEAAPYLESLLQRCGIQPS